jgi:hypothetical protein
MIQVNRYRSVNSLSLIEKAISLERLAQNLSNKMLINKNFEIPDLSSQTSKTLIIAIILSGETSISQYDFSNDRKY